MEKEIRFIVVWSSSEKKFYVDEIMAEAVFDGDDVWLPDTNEWERGLGDHEADFQGAFRKLQEMIGGN